MHLTYLISDRLIWLLTHCMTIKKPPDETHGMGNVRLTPEALIIQEYLGEQHCTNGGSRAKGCKRMCSRLTYVFVKLSQRLPPMACWSWHHRHRRCSMLGGNLLQGQLCTMGRPRQWMTCRRVQLPHHGPCDTPALTHTPASVNTLLTVLLCTPV